MDVPKFNTGESISFCALSFMRALEKCVVEPISHFIWGKGCTLILKLIPFLWVDWEIKVFVDCARKTGICS